MSEFNQNKRTNNWWLIYDKIALEYVHGFKPHFDLSVYSKGLSRKANLTTKNLKQRYLNKIYKNLKITATDNLTGNAIGELTELDDSLFDEAMVEFSKKANEEIEKRYKNYDINIIRNNMMKVNDFLSDSSQLVTDNQLNAKASAFFNSLYESLKYISNISPRDWNDFVLVWALSVDEVRKNSSKLKKSIANLEKQLVNIGNGQSIINDIKRYLINIIRYVGKSKDGKYSSKSMSNSIGAMMGKIAGDFYSAIELKEVTEIDNSIGEILSTKNSEKNFGNNPQTISLNQTVDIVKGNKAVNISTTLRDYSIVGEIDSKIAWFKGKNGSSRVNDFQISSKTNLINSLKKIYNTHSAFYNIYNTIAFQNSQAFSLKDNKNFSQIKTSVANELLIKSFTNKNSAYSFIVIDGYIYPIISIIDEYINSIKEDERIIKIRIDGLSKVDNRLIEIEKGLNPYYALQRSYRVKRQIDKLNVAISINKKSLIAMSKRLKIAPLNNKKI